MLKCMGEQYTRWWVYIGFLDHQVDVHLSRSIVMCKVLKSFGHGA